MNTARWNRILWTQRFACPVVLIACCVVGYFAWRSGNVVVALIDAVLGGINLVMSWMQWFVFQPRR